MNLQEKGQAGERRAEDYLKSLGFEIVFRRFRIRGGEIDLIAAREGCLYFIEVKFRLSPRYGDPFEAVTPYKIKFLRRTAEFFLLRHREFRRFPRYAFAAVAIREYPHERPIEWCLIPT